MDSPDLDPEIARIRSRLTSLEAERAELVARLAGLERARQAAMYHSPPQVDAAATSEAVTATSPAARKIELLRRRFAGRTDVFPVRWENVRTQRSGYAPACTNEWVKGICGKPQVKCAERVNDIRTPVRGAVARRWSRRLTRWQKMKVSRGQMEPWGPQLAVQVRFRAASSVATFAARAQASKHQPANCKDRDEQGYRHRNDDRRYEPFAHHTLRHA